MNIIGRKDTWNLWLERDLDIYFKKGNTFMTSTKNQDFWPPPHASTWY